MSLRVPSNWQSITRVDSGAAKGTILLAFLILLRLASAFLTAFVVEHRAYTTDKPDYRNPCTNKCEYGQKKA